LLCLGLGLGVAGCSMPIGDMPQAIGGLPPGAPARPVEQAAFPAVHDMPPARRDTLLEPEEQQRVQRELQRARESQESRAASEK
jgi:hypothetical protein